MSSPPPQSFVKGSLWPSWGGYAWVELAFLRLAARDGFPVVSPMKYPAKLGRYVFPSPCVYEHKYTCAEFCSCRIVTAFELGTRQLRTIEVNLKHSHPPCQDPDERERLREKAREGIQRLEVVLCDSARKELEFRWQLGKSYHEEQQAVIRDLKIALGEVPAREVERKAREAGVLVAGYPKKSLFDRSPPPQLHLPASDAPGPSQSKPQPASTRQPALTDPPRFFNDVPKFPSTSDKHDVKKAGKSSLEGLKTMTQPTTVPEVTTSSLLSPSPLTLAEYLRTLDCTGAFDFSSLEPYFVKNGVRTPQQLETYARGHWSSLMSRVEHESGLGAMEREVLGSCLEEKLGVEEED
ncbi:hypothetical protein JCM1840_003730 [Sporobolomyces johnsonii]